MGIDLLRTLPMMYEKHSEHKYKFMARLSQYLAKRKGIETFIAPSGYID